MSERPEFSLATREQPVRAERFRAALQARTLGLAGLGDAANFRALYLERGTAILLRPDGAETLEAPLAAWFPWTGEMRLRLDAGAQGTHLLLGRPALDRALRQRPEAVQLRFMADRTAVLRLTETAPETRAVSACFEGILAETVAPGVMTAAVVESFLHVLLVQFYRGQGTAGATRPESGSAAELAARFVTLVENHFRDHWAASRYAMSLGITRDRLNDICLAVHGRTPGRLIRARLELEARLHLDSSSLALGQIAGLLGFSGTSQFNRFFKAQTGIPPGRYRSERVLRDAKASVQATTAPYAWP